MHGAKKNCAWRSRKSERLQTSFTTEIPLFRKKKRCTRCCCYKKIPGASINRTRHLRLPFCLLFRLRACQKNLGTCKLSTNQTNSPLFGGLANWIGEQGAGARETFVWLVYNLLVPSTAEKRKKTQRVFEKRKTTGSEWPSHLRRKQFKHNRTLRWSSKSH